MRLFFIAILIYSIQTAAETLTFTAPDSDGFFVSSDTRQFDSKNPTIPLNRNTVYQIVLNTPASSPVYFSAKPGHAPEGFPESACDAHTYTDNYYTTCPACFSTPLTGGGSNSLTFSFTTPSLNTTIFYSSSQQCFYGRFIVGTPVDQPLTFNPVIDCIDSSITFTIKPYLLNADGQIQFFTRAYYYKGQAMVPGPTVRMKAGSYCNFTVENRLPITPNANCTYHINGPHCPDTTNLHVHGFWVSPEEDKINTLITPNDQYSYVYHIPNDHMAPATHWYHAHHHGSVFLHVMGGMAGVILMEPSSSFTLPSSLSLLYNASHSQVLMITHLNFQYDKKAFHEGLDRNFQDLAYPSISAGYQNVFPFYESVKPNETFFTELDDWYLVNGRFRPVVTIQPEDVTLFRILEAVSMYSAEIQMKPWGICSLKLMSRDGILHQGTYADISTIILLPGTRADVAIRCPQSAVGQTIVFGIVANATRNIQMGSFLRASQSVLFTLKVEELGRPKISDFPTEFINIAQSPYLTNLRGITESNLRVGPRGIKSIHFGFEGNFGAINNQPYPGFHAAQTEGVVTNFVEGLCLNSVYQFHLNNTRGTSPDYTGIVHPYHHHINPMQIYDNACPTGVSEYNCNELVMNGEWRDVVPTNDLVFRLKPTLFTGFNVVVHCHLLDHEDAGMMGLYNISEGLACPSYPYLADDTTGSASTSSPLLLLLLAVIISVSCNI